MNTEISIILAAALESQKRERRNVVAIVFSTTGYCAYIEELKEHAQVPKGMYFNTTSIMGIDVEISPALDCAFCLVCEDENQDRNVRGGTSK